MYRLFTILLLCLFSLGLFGQKLKVLPDENLNHTIHRSGDFTLSIIAPNVLIDNSEGALPGAGLKLRYFVGKRFSFDTDLAIGRDYLHFGPGLIGIPLWLLASGLGLGLNDVGGDSKEDIASIVVVATVMILSAEHFAYHLPVGTSSDFSPYISLLRFKSLKYIRTPESPDEVVSSPNCAVGIELNKYAGRFVMSPYTDFEIAYDGSGHGFNFGFSAGYYFRSK